MKRRKGRANWIVPARRERDRNRGSRAPARREHPQLDGFAADGYGAEDAFFSSVPDDVGGLAMGTAVVLGCLQEVERHNAVSVGRSQALILAKTKRPIDYIRGHAGFLKKV